MRDITVTAADISCEHCQRTIEGGLGEKPGVSSVRVDVPSKAVHVEYDETVTSEEAVKAELDDLGYPVGQPA